MNKWKGKFRATKRIFAAGMRREAVAEAAEQLGGGPHVACGPVRTVSGELIVVNQFSDAVNQSDVSFDKSRCGRAAQPALFWKRGGGAEGGKEAA